MTRFVVAFGQYFPPQYNLLFKGFDSFKKYLKHQIIHGIHFVSDLLRGPTLTWWPLV